MGKQNKSMGKQNQFGQRSQMEKELLKMMIDFDVDQTQLAEHEGVTPQAINNRLKRLNKEKYERFKILIKQVGNSNKL